MTAGAALPKGDAGISSPACLCLTSNAGVPCTRQRRFDRGPGESQRCGCARGQLVPETTAWSGGVWRLVALAVGSHDRYVIAPLPPRLRSFQEGPRGRVCRSCYLRTTGERIRFELAARELPIQSQTDDRGRRTARGLQADITGCPRTATARGEHPRKRAGTCGVGPRRSRHNWVADL